MFTNLKLLLWRTRIHQNRMAKEVEIDEGLLSRIINGYREPTTEQKQKIARYLEVEEEWLFARDHEIARNKTNASNGNNQRN